MKIFRWKAIVPLTTALVIMGVVWRIFLNPAVRWGVERVGTQMVGAKVDVAAADVRLRDGVVVLRGLAVTNPNSPMTNLFEADDIVVNVRVAPLLERKVVVDTAAVRGMRFGTARATSGALDDPGPASGAAFRAVSEWAGKVRVPPLSLAGLQQVVNVDGLNPDSLRTIQAARGIFVSADSSRIVWIDDLRALDPRPQVDSAAALVRRLEGQNIRTLGVAGARDAAESLRGMVNTLGQLDDRLAALEHDVTSGIRDIEARVRALEQARAADYAYAQRLLRLPSLDGPSLGPQLFSEPVVEQLAGVLYWVHLAERHMPPGIEKKLRAGSGRTRRAGTNVSFPREEALPRFLLRFAEATAEIGGTGVGAGDYAARITGLSTEPALAGEPVAFGLERLRAVVGPRDIRVGGMLDHRRRPVRDSVSARLAGVSLPALTIPGLDVTLVLGEGTTVFSLDRRGDSIAGRWSWVAPSVRWERAARPDTSAPTGVVRGVQQRVEEALWAAVSRVGSVEVDARFGGTFDAPRLSITSNVADAVAGALRDQLGAEIRRAEAEVRRQVDALVADRVAEARAAQAAVETEVRTRLMEERTRVAEVRTELERRLRDLVAGGIRLP